MKSLKKILISNVDFQFIFTEKINTLLTETQPCVTSLLVITATHKMKLMSIS